MENIEKIDFIKYQREYSYLNNYDIKKLNKFFNKKEIFKEVDARSLLQRIFWFILKFFLKKRKKYIFKENNLVKNFISDIDEKISYNKTSKFFQKTPEELLKLFQWKKIISNSKKIFQDYDRLDKNEDSLEFKIWENSKNWESKIQVNWIEIQTSNYHKTKNWWYYETNNHFYLIKFKFLDARFRINSAINILQDISDNLWRKLMHIWWFILIPVWILLHTWEHSNINLLTILSQNLNIPQIPLFIAIIIISFSVIWFVYSKFLRKNKINLENIEFEKKFDVYDEDQIESRKILTPSFMYRILDFVNKINKNRVYEFFFLWDEFYIKYDLLKSWKSSFMEIDFSKWQDYVLRSFLEFYLEIKNITEIAKDLNVFYFDKGSFSKEILKNI